MKKATSKKNRINKLPILFMTLMLAFPILQFLVFYLYANINSIFLAFKTYDSNTGKYIFSGFNNISQFLSEMTTSFALKSATKNSLFVYALNLFVLMPVQILSSYYVYKGGRINEI